MKMPLKCARTPPVKPNIDPGMRVLSVAGVGIGEVGRVADDRFEVVAESETVWVSAQAVFTVDDRRVTLICTPDGLKRYEVQPPND